LPALEVTCSRLMPVSTSSAVTVASATLDPDASITVPRIEVEVVCANPETAARTKIEVKTVGFISTLLWKCITGRDGRKALKLSVLMAPGKSTGNSAEL
jgi:hypothetical protein